MLTIRVNINLLSTQINNSPSTDKHDASSSTRFLANIIHSNYLIHFHAGLKVSQFVSIHRNQCQFNSSMVNKYSIKY